MAEILPPKLGLTVWITTVIIHNVVAIIGRGKKKNAKIIMPSRLEIVKLALSQPE